MRQNISSNTKWESIVGYCRAVRVGNTIHVAGTVASDQDGNIMGATAGEQAEYIFEKIGKALTEAGAGFEHVVRTRVYVTDIDAQWEGVGQAHGEVFREIRPASTMLEVSKLVGDFLVEIEVDAIIE